ncbi:MAG: deoxyribose-phosphate aldolase [Terracidiphilus sp.]
MTATALIQDLDLEFNNGAFDAAAFSACALASVTSLAAVIDHTLLKPDASREQIEKLCNEALRYRFACAMVNPVWASRAVSMLSSSGIAVGAVIGFPLGASLLSTLCQEATALIRLGVRELDMVLPIGLLKSDSHDLAENTIRTITGIVHSHGVVLKVILETSLLTMAEKLRASEIAIQAGADFIKTSTGFAATGATPADVALMRGVAGSRCGIKAAGGIRTLACVKALLDAGANRIGASASVEILRELDPGAS